MQYVLMFVDRPDLQAAVPPDRLDKVYGEISTCFEQQRAAGHIADGGAEQQLLADTLGLTSRRRHAVKSQ